MFAKLAERRAKLVASLITLRYEVEPSKKMQRMMLKSLQVMNFKF